MTYKLSLKIRETLLVRSERTEEIQIEMLFAWQGRMADAVKRELSKLEDNTLC